MRAGDSSLAPIDWATESDAHCDRLMRQLQLTNPAFNLLSNAGGACLWIDAESAAIPNLSALVAGHYLQLCSTDLHAEVIGHAVFKSLGVRRQEVFPQM